MWMVLKPFYRDFTETMRHLWLSVLQSVEQASSRGPWCVWWKQKKGLSSCHLMNAPHWNDPTVSRAAIRTPVEQSGTTLTGVVWVWLRSFPVCSSHVLHLPILLLTHRDRFIPAVTWCNNHLSTLLLLNLLYQKHWICYLFHNCPQAGTSGWILDEISWCPCTHTSKMHRFWTVRNCNRFKAL